MCANTERRDFSLLEEKSHGSTGGRRVRQLNPKTDPPKLLKIDAKISPMIFFGNFGRTLHVSFCNGHMPSARIYLFS
jgi:hypothetical protein